MRSRAKYKIPLLILAAYLFISAYTAYLLTNNVLYSALICSAFTFSLIAYLLLYFKKNYTHRHGRKRK